MHLNLSESAGQFIETVTSPDVRVHFAQLGEDALLWHYFHGRSAGFYVDIGCHHPYRYSNTHLLHRYRNWTGINIDADPRAIEHFKKARPGDINLQIGIGSTDRQQEFTLFEDGAVNTFDTNIAASQTEIFPRFSSFMAEIRPLSDVLAEHIPGEKEIDYMNIDCEGLDHEIILSSDWNRFRPDIVTVEIHGLMVNDPMTNPTVSFLAKQGYRMSAHCLVTTFFERIAS